MCLTDYRTFLRQEAMRRAAEAEPDPGDGAPQDSPEARDRSRAPVPSVPTTHEVLCHG